MRLLIETILKYFAFYYQIEKVVLQMFRKISANATVVFEFSSWGSFFELVDTHKEKFLNLNAKLLNFVIGSFPIIKNTSKISLNGLYSQKPTSAKFGKSLWGIFVFLCKIFSKIGVFIQIIILRSIFLQKLEL